MSIRLVIVFSDLHCGSTVGLCPPGFETIEGQRVGLSLFQEWLWQCWTDATMSWIPAVTGGDPFAVVLLGDMIEGNHHHTKQIISPESADHVACAAHALSPTLERADKVYVVKGTECHVGNAEDALGNQFGAEKDPDSGRRAFNRLRLNVAGVSCAFRHHVGTTSRPWLESGELARAISQEQEEATIAGHTPPRVLVAGHRHRFGKYDDGRRLCVVNGAWQGLTTYGHKVVSPAVPRPTMIALDWRNRPDGELPDVVTTQYVAKQQTEIAL